MAKETKKESLVKFTEPDFKGETESVLEEILKAQAAEEPSQTTGQDKGVIHKPDASLETPMGFTKTKSAGYTYIYDTITGEQSVTNNNMLMAQLKKKRPDGTKVFTTFKPLEMRKSGGSLKCFLHPDDPNRDHYDSMGLGTCRKANLINEFHRVRHMQKKHKDEWAAIEAERKTKKDEAAELFNKTLMEKLAS